MADDCVGERDDILDGDDAAAGSVDCRRPVAGAAGGFLVAADMLRVEIRRCLARDVVWREVVFVFVY